MLDYRFFNINSLSEKEFNYWYSLMSESKKKRVSDYFFTKDRYRSVCAHMLLCRMIGEMFSCESESVRIDFNPDKKPFAVGFPCCVSVSHSGDMVFCAVSDREVGVDIEKIRAVKMPVIKKVCTDSELKYVINSDDVFKRFFEVFTFKEAYCKCFDIPLYDRVAQIDFLLASCKKFLLENDRYIAHIVMA